MLKLWKRWRKTVAPTATATPARPAPESPSAQEADAIARAFRGLLLKDQPQREQPPTTPEKLVGQAVEQLLRNSDQRAAAVPRLPTLLPLLLKQLRDPLASARDYAALIMQDPLISPTVLRIANSAYFNPYRKSLDNFERVVADLGVVRLRMVLSAAVMQPVLLGASDNLPQRVWQQSLECAAVCQGLAQREGIDPYLAYLTGLIHAIGTVTLYNQVQLMQREYLGGTQPGRALVEELIERWAKPLSVAIAEDWELPREVIQALTAQHDPQCESALGDILRRADAVCEAREVLRAGLIEPDALDRLAGRLRVPATLLQALDGGAG